MFALAQVEEVDDHGRSEGVTQPWSRHGEHRPLDFDYVPGDVFGRYVITGRLGAGGMGAVYAARDPELGRMVSLKISAPDPAEAAGRLLREAQCIAKVRHDHVVSIFEAGIDGRRGFVALQHVAGFDMDHHLSRLEPAPAAGRSLDDVATPLRWFVQVGRGLAAVHDAGLVHRDFKPSNVLIDPHGKAWLTDFGIACEEGVVDEAGTMIDQAASSVTCSRSMGPVGTLKFMAPEQFDGEPATHAFDQFAYCVALYRLLFGEHPFGDGNAMRMRSNAARGKIRKVPRGCAVPTAVRDVLARGLDPDPSRRFATMGGLVDAVESALAA